MAVVPVQAFSGTSQADEFSFEVGSFAPLRPPVTCARSVANYFGVFPCRERTLKSAEGRDMPEKMTPSSWASTATRQGPLDALERVSLVWNHFRGSDAAGGAARVLRKSVTRRQAGDCGPR